MVLTHPRHSVGSFYFCLLGQRVNAVGLGVTVSLFSRFQAPSGHSRVEGQSEITRAFFLEFAFSFLVLFLASEGVSTSLMSALTLQRDVKTDGNGFINRLHLPVQFMNIIVGDKRCNSDRKKNPPKNNRNSIFRAPG